ncbi:MAG TPA: hypothetical protein DEH78_08340, partial [Solibacterales bacterium]|nr:hypothetical protein [Bryobacterales bacterium]
MTHSGEENSGLFESFDGGATFDSAEDANGRGGKLVSRRHRNGMHPFISEMGYFCHSVVFHPARKGVVLAAVEAQGTMSGIWVSHDGGQSWNQAREGLPPGDQFGRTTLHIAGASEVVYALSGRPRTGELLGMYRSSDLGERWTPLRMPKAFGARGQFSYNNCVAADRKRPGTVAAGGVDLFVSLDGGENWRQSSSGDLPAFHSQYAHHDHHGLAIVGKRIYSANDGGFAISNDLGETWETRNNGLSLAMLYDLDVSPMNAESLGGGCQDLGVWLRGPLQPRQTKSERALRRELRGDGGWTCFHPAEPHTVFASTQRMTIYRHRAEEGWQELSIGASKQETRSVWMAVLAMDRSDRRKGG